MAIGIGIGLPFRRGQSGYPRAGLTGRYVQLTEGGNLINTLGGTSIPYVSGSGLDQIFDFSVLNDDRFDKGSYVGNAYGLPEYYNFPYVGIYYDATSEATRKYWKLTDFAYSVYNTQSLLLDDQIFLKAKATTDTSNIIASWNELLIYSTALTSYNLSKTKTYIGIQDDFYGDNVIINGDFGTNDFSSWVGPKGGWSVINQKAVFSGLNDSSTTYILQGSLIENKSYKVSFDISNCISGDNPSYIQLSFSPHILITGNGSFSYVKLATIKNFIVRGRADRSFAIDNIIVQQLYQNYYKS